MEEVITKEVFWYNFTWWKTKVQYVRMVSAMLFWNVHRQWLASIYQICPIIVLMKEFIQMFYKNSSISKVFEKKFQQTSIFWKN